MKNAVGKGAKAMMAKANGQWKWFDEKIQNKMTDEFLSFYGKNIYNKSTLINGVKDFLNWCKHENISMAVCTNKTEHLAVDLLKKTIMIGDSETDDNAAKAAEIPMILLEDGYTEKNIDEIYHNHLIKDFVAVSYTHLTLPTTVIV